MERFIFFSKTNWNETPRLRHQMANLLISRGHEIIFFQKPKYLLQKKDIQKIDGLTLEKTTQLIHHQLRFINIFSVSNEILEKYSIKNSLKKYKPTDEDIVINFNYDYYFLREIFPKNKIITVINDDFVAQAKFFQGAHVRRALLRTCSKSDSTLVVSYPLAKQVAEVCRPHLFLPWSDVKYKRIERSGNYKSVLLWAHIDSRIEFSLIEEAARRLPDFDFFIVGPVSKKSEGDVNIIRKNMANIHILPPHKLDDLDLSKFSVSIIPYKQGIKSIEAVTMANKSLQIMARGLPLVTYGMPYFYEHLAIRKAKTSFEFVEGIRFFYENFFKIQDDIEKLINKNGAEERYQQLMEIVRDK
jgi:hypothetical protein